MSTTVAYRDESSGDQTENANELIDRLKIAIESEPSLKLDAQAESIQVDGASARAKGTTTLTADDVSDENASFVVELQSTEDEWKIVSIVEQGPESTLRASASGAIDSLGWLVGTWQDDSPQQLVSQIEYVPGRKFLRRTISESQNGSILEVKMIGYDPNSHSVQSWTYFTDGGFGTGQWSGGEDHWRLRMTRTLPDGQIAPESVSATPEIADPRSTWVTSTSATIP